jgi:signal transduction histidine kinase
MLTGNRPARRRAAGGFPAPVRGAARTPPLLPREYATSVPAADDGGCQRAYCAGMTARGRTSTTRRNVIADGVLAVALAAFIAMAIHFGARYHHQGYRHLDAAAFPLLIITTGPLAWRRRYPVAVLAVIFGATLAYFMRNYPEGPIWLPLIIAFFTAAVRGHRLVADITAAAGFALFPWLDYLLRNGQPPSITFLAGLAAWLLLLLGTAEIARIRRERATEAARIEEEATLRRASEERLRIARELHDAIGHHLSLINVQSGVALHLNEDLPEQARNSFAAIKQASKEALSELRSVLSVLRQEDEQAPRSPTPTLARLEDLVAQAAAAGIEVRTESGGDPRPVPFSVDIAAFRIVQEALTNVTRHAGPATATVRISYQEHDLTVQVDDDGRGSPPHAAPPDGNGIRGMRERAAALGGDLLAGPRPGGGFRVRARLPLNSAPAPEPSPDTPPGREP